MKKLLLPFLFVALMFGCKNDDEIPTVDSRTIFRFTLPDNYIGADSWIILRDDATGELVDARSFADSSTISFQSTKVFTNNKLAVTFFYSTAVDAHAFRAEVYRGVDLRNDWSINTKPFTLQSGGKILGVYSLGVTDMPANYFATLSNEFGTVGGEGNYGTKWAGFFNVTEKSKNNGFLSVGNVPGDPKYMWIQNMTPEVDTTISFTDPGFKAFDKVFTLSFPSTRDVSTDVKAYDLTLSPDFGFHVHSIPSALSSETSELKIGYLNEFRHYNTFIKIGGYTYRATGGIPNAIEYVGPDGYTTSVKSDAIQDYSITATKPYEYSKTYYEWDDPNSNDALYFTYYAPTGTTTHFDVLTPELISKYSIDMSKLKYAYTDFMVKGRSYEVFLSMTYYPLYYSMSYEETTIEVK